MSNKRWEGNAYFLSVVIKIGSVILGLLYTVLLSRYLGPEIKGQVAYVTSVTSIGSIVATMGMHQAYPYYRKNVQVSSFLSKYINSILFIHVLYFAVSFGLRSFMGSLSIEAGIAVLLIPLMSYSRIVGYVYLVESPNERNMIYIFVEILEIVCVMLLIFTLDSTLYIAVALLLAKDLVLSLIYSIKLHFKFSIRDIDFRFALQLMKFGFTPMIALLMSTLNYRVDVLMLEKYSNVTMADIGVYSIGVAIGEKLIMLPEAIKEILLSNLVKGKSEQEVAKTIRFCIPIVLIFCLGFFALGRSLVPLIFGKVYADAYGITLITMFGTIGIVFYKMIATYNIVEKKQNVNLGLLSISVLINVVLNGFMIPVYGIIGAAVSSSISYTVCAILFTAYFSRKTGVKIQSIIFLNNTDIRNVKKTLTHFFSKRHTKGDYHE